MRLHRSWIRAALLGTLVLAASPLFSEETAQPFGLQSRVPWSTSNVVGTPEPPPPYMVERAFPRLKFDHPVYIAQEPGTNRFLVAELSGKIYAFTADTPDAESRQLFLDTKRQLYSFSFHPKYEENGQIFVFSPTDTRDKSKTQQSRVSRFQASLTAPRSCSADTEQIIVQWLAGGHNGGEAIIGPDGYLYVSTGDSTSGSDPKGTGQGVDDLLSVIMRLDVDHPSPDKAYSIPADNPFVRDSAARPEIWAFGFRNPWRMSFDPKTGSLWVGDVGQDLWEMIWVVQRGGNYGWSVQEGSHPFHPQKPAGPGPILPPVIEHHHTECRSITGGYVYYGDKFPELKGAYFYGDYEYGQVWGLKYDGQQVTWHQELADTPLRIASFGVSRAGDIYLVDHPSGELYALARAPQQTAHTPFPMKLSETGLFASVPQQQLAPGVIPYSVNVPQWLDNAAIDRFAAIPNKMQLDFVERSADATTWSFPDGTVHAETISLEMEQGKPESRRRIETRILVKQQNHWLGYSYLWNETQTDAALAGARGTDLKLKITDFTAPGGVRQQTWHVPSRDECMVCHSRAAGFVLGLNTPQMNREHDFGGIRDNQLRAWNHVGLFRQPLKKPPTEYDSLPNPYAKSGDVEAQARAWLHVNCSVCHVADGGGNSKLQLRYYQKLPETQLIHERPLHGTFDLSNAHIITPGDPFASVLLYRISKWGRGRMPHVGATLHDERALQLMDDWIRQMPKSNPPGDTNATDARADEAAVAQALKEAAPLPADKQAAALQKLLASTRTAFIAAHLVARSSQSAAWRAPLIEAALAHSEPNVRDLFERFVPENRRTQRLGETIDPQLILNWPGDAERGRQLFFGGASQCKTCHRVQKEGGTLGPDLSEIGKKYPRNELLESLLDPSKKIDPKFQTHTLVTTAGKVFSGTLVERTDTEIVLNILEGAETRVVRAPMAEVEELQTQKKSLMPDRLLRDLTIQQAADLLEFLRSLQSPTAM